MITLFLIASRWFSGTARPRRWACLAAVGVALATSLGACASGGRGPYRSTEELGRDPVRAERLAREAADVLEEDPARAEELLRLALGADLYCGSAHNNLGVIHLNRGELYQAANEFEWARKLMPGHPDPRLNLALTLHRAGRARDATDAARAALEVRPEYVPAKQALALLLSHAGVRTDESDRLLDDVSLEGDSPRWRSWARLELSRRALPPADGAR